MRCAAFFATPRGLALALRLRGALPDGVEVFAREGRAADGAARRFTRLSDAVAEAFFQYDALIFFMAAGIAVRMIAPHLKSKLTDPAVLVIDERGRYVVSLLSGHVGGGNMLARRAAACLGAEAVVTTATDAGGLTAPDALAAELGLRPVPKPMIQVVNRALLGGAPVRYAVDAALARRAFFMKALAARGIACAALSAEEACAASEWTAFITADGALRAEKLLCLVPRRLVAGVGCRRGVSEDEARAALAEACARIGQELSAVSMIASAAVKRDEAGLLALAASLGVEARFFENDALAEKIRAYGLEESEFVRARIGVGNVCEAAALCCVAAGRTALRKTKFTKVTVALLWEK